MFKLIDRIEQPLYEEKDRLRDFSEDAYLFTPNLVAIADGITKPSDGERWINEGYSDPYWIVHTFLNSLKKIAILREKEQIDDVKEVLKLAVDEMLSSFFPTFQAGKMEKPSCCFSMVMRHMKDRNKFTFVNVGGNFIYYNDKVIDISPTLKDMNTKFEADIKSKVDKGSFLKNKKFFKTLREKLFYRNTDRGYPAIDMTYDWIDHPETTYITEELNSGDKIMLSTDGLTRGMRLYNTYKEEEFFENCLNKGLEEILREQREIELDDWERIKYPRFMPTMDVCALILEVE